MSGNYTVDVCLMLCNDVCLLLCFFKESSLSKVYI